MYNEQEENQELERQEENQELEKQEEVKKVYPTAPDADGFFYATEDEEAFEILTKEYSNGNLVKKTILPRCKKEAVVRETFGRDMDEIGRFVKKDSGQGNQNIAYITVATKIEGKKETYEYFEGLKSKDINRLILMNTALNF